VSFAYVEPDTAVQNIQGRTLFEIPWLWIILSYTALKNPALSHKYCSEKELYKSITLSNLTFVWKFSGEQYFWNTFRLFSKGKFTTAYRKQNRHIKTTLQFTLIVGNNLPSFFHWESNTIKNIRTKLKDNGAMITRADKGNSLVILPTTQYDKK